MIPKSDTNSYSIAAHYCIHPSPLIAGGYRVLQRGSYFSEQASHSLARAVVSPTADPKVAGIVPTLARRVSWLGCALLEGLAALPTMGMPLARSLLDRIRPELSIVVSEVSTTAVPDDNLHLMTANMALGPGWLNAKGRFASSVERAQCMGQRLNALSDSELPSIFLAQEVWDEQATEALVTQLQQRYPYIIHSVGSNVLGRNSGLFVASRYPISDIEFRPFDSFPSSDNLSNKGILRAEIQAGERRLAIYNLHAISPETVEGAALRKKHLQSLLHWIQEEADHYDDIFVAGDFNLSPHNDQGRVMDEFEDVQRNFFSHFIDPFLSEHDTRSCQRTKGKPSYVTLDVPEGHALEPEGSFYDIHQGSSWQKMSWKGGIPGCRYDFILLYKKEGSTYRSHAEIRRLFGHLSDHLPLSAIFQRIVATPTS